MMPELHLANTSMYILQHVHGLQTPGWVLQRNACCCTTAAVTICAGVTVADSALAVLLSADAGKVASGAAHIQATSRFSAGSTYRGTARDAEAQPATHNSPIGKSSSSSRDAQPASQGHTSAGAPAPAASSSASSPKGATTAAPASQAPANATAPAAAASGTTQAAVAPQQGVAAASQPAAAQAAPQPQPQANVSSQLSDDVSIFSVKKIKTADGKIEVVVNPLPAFYSSAHADAGLRPQVAPDATQDTAQPGSAPSSAAKACNTPHLSSHEADIAFTAGQNGVSLTTLSASCAAAAPALSTLGGGCSIKCDSEDDLAKITLVASRNMTSASANAKAGSEADQPAVCR